MRKAGVFLPVLLFLLFPAFSYGASTSTTSELVVVIPAAIEVQILGSEPIEFDGENVKQAVSLGLRANTAWSLQAGAVNGLSNAPVVTLEGKEGVLFGERNQDESVQEIDLIFTQKLSWSDDLGSYPTSITLQISQTL